MGIVNKPHTFSAGAASSSSDMNENFDEIYDEFNGNISSANVADDAITTAKIVDEAVNNDKLKTGAGQPGGGWDDWTPTFTNLSGGTLNNAKYKQVGKTVFYRWDYTLTGANVSGSVSFTLPVTAISYPSSTQIGWSRYEDTGTASYIGSVQYASGSGLLATWLASGTYVSTIALSSTVPHTWASTDTIKVQGFYEAA